MSEVQMHIHMCVIVLNDIECYSAFDNDSSVYMHLSHSLFVALCVSRGEWKAYSPRTNILWLDYLARKLLTKLKRPGGRIRAIAQSLLQHSSAGDALRHRV